MATHDYIISNASGASVRADLNNALAAIVSNNSNATSPATTYAYQWWADTTTGQLKLRNSANSAWITIFELDGTMLMEDGTVSAPGLAFASDLNTGFFRSAADKINFATGGAERLEIGSSEVVFNDPSNDVDFRVESNGNTHMLFVDAGNDRVGIATSSPGTDLDVNNGSANCTIRARTATGFSSFLNLLPNGSGSGISLAANSDSSAQLFNQLNSHLAFGTNNAERVRIDSSGRLLVGATSVYSPTNGGQVPCVVQDAGDHRTALVVNNQTNGSSAGSAVILAAHGQDWQLEATSVLKGNRDFTIKAGTNERLRIDNDGRLLVGTSSAQGDSLFQVEGNSSSGSGGAAVSLRRGEAASAMSSGDFLGSVEFMDNSGENFARIIGRTDAASGGVNGNPGRLEFYTESVGSDSGPVERVRIDSSGRVGVGTQSPSFNVDVVSTSFGLRVTNSSESKQIKVGCNDPEIISVGAPLFLTAPSGQPLILRSNGNEQARVDSSGNLLVGKTSQDAATAGFQVRRDVVGLTQITVSGGGVLDVNRLTNDGTIVNLRQNTTVEGTISVSGSTVSYNGGHLARWSQLAGGAERTEILRGSVLSNLDEMCEWGEEDNEQLNRMKVSDVEGDVNVSGVFQAWDDDDDTYTNDFYCAMTGDFIIRIAQGTTVARGDLLMSAGDGTAKPQDDDIVRSKTIAKVTSTTVSTTYSDGSYCVPCVLMAC